MSRTAPSGPARVLRTKPRVRYAFIDAHQDSFSIRRMCLLLEVSPSGYYDYRDRASSARAKRNAAITEKIKAIHTRSKGVYGSPRIQAALEREGEKVAIGTVKKIMQREGLRSKLSPKRKNPKRETAVSPNLLTEEGDPSRPNQAWSGDFTYIWTREGWLYLASVADRPGRCRFVQDNGFVLEENRGLGLWKTSR